MFIFAPNLILLRMKKEKEEKKEKRPIGRPRTSQMKDYHYKADGDLVPVLDSVENRNNFINQSVREKSIKDGLLKITSDEKK